MLTIIKTTFLAPPSGRKRVFGPPHRIGAGISGILHSFPTLAKTTALFAFFCKFPWSLLTEVFWGAIGIDAVAFDLSNDTRVGTWAIFCAAERRKRIFGPPHRLGTGRSEILHGFPTPAKTTALSPLFANVPRPFSRPRSHVKI